MTAPLTYPTLSDFMASMARVNPDAEFSGPDTDGVDKVGVVEQMLLLLLTRWQLEDEGDKADELSEVHADMATLNRDLTDPERGQVMAHLVAWSGNGDGWLYEYITRTMGTHSEG